MCEGSSLTAATAPRRSNYEKCCQKNLALVIPLQVKVVGSFLPHLARAGPDAMPVTTRQAQKDWF